MPCKDWSALLERYRASVKGYNEAADGLKGSPGVQFNISWHRAERARMEVDAARATLLDHEHDHLCFMGDAVPKRNPEPVHQTVEEWVLGDQGQSGG